MKIRTLIHTLFIFFVALSYANENQDFNIVRKDHSIINGYFTPPNESLFPIAILIQGSQCESVLLIQNEFKYALNSIGVGVVSIEKHGITSGYVDRYEYDRTNCRDLRINDHFLCIETIRNGAIPGWDGRFIILGGSEGGAIAGTIAANTPETVATLLFSVGGGLPTREEMKCAFRRYIEKQGSHYAEDFVSFMDKQLEACLKDPTPNKHFIGYTYKWWASHLRYDSLLIDLLSLTCPIFYAHGTEDDMIPIESADILAETFKRQGKSNLYYRRLEGYNHDIREPPLDVISEAFVWLQEILIQISKERQYG